MDDFGMRFNSAPSVPEIQKQFCRDRTELQPVMEYFWQRDRATGVLEMKSYEKEKKYFTVRSPHKVIQSYVLRRLSNHSVVAVAIVSSGGGGTFDVNGWPVSLIDANTDFAAQLHKSSLFSQVQDEDNTYYFVANIGGGHAFTELEYMDHLMKERRQHEAVETYARQAPLRIELKEKKLAWQQAEEKEKQLLQQEREEFSARARYALTRLDIQELLPTSPSRSFNVDAHRSTNVLQVYVLLSQAMEVYICAIIDESCTWLHYNSVGCCDYRFAFRPCQVTNRFSAIHEQSRAGAELLRKKVGEVVVIGQSRFLIVNVGGGAFALYHSDWQEEKKGIEQRIAIKLRRNTEKRERETDKNHWRTKGLL